jgi:hypothetical protein
MQEENFGGEFKKNKNSHLFIFFLGVIYFSFFNIFSAKIVFQVANFSE